MRIVLAHHESLLRESLPHLLGHYGHQVVATAATGAELVGRTGRAAPDLIVTAAALRSPDRAEGVRAAIAARRAAPGVGVVVLAQDGDPEQATALLATGRPRTGYLLRQHIGSGRALVRTIEQVNSGATVIDPEVAQRLRRPGPPRDPVATMPRRRREVIALMAQGCSNARIARTLGISEAAVCRHISFIFQSLDLPVDPDVHRRVIAVLRFVDGPMPVRADRPAT